MKALIITTEGSPYTKRVNGYSELQEIVGGLIDAVTHHEVKMSAYVNDEGLLLGLPMNRIASVMFGRYLVGDVVVCGVPDEDGNDTDVLEAVVAVAGYNDHIRKWHDEAVADREALSR
jgi:hypothetical protein